VPSALLPCALTVSKSTDTLIAQLASDSSVARESAVARLTVIGARAVDRLLDVASSSAPSIARAAALQALERIGERRALATALALAGDADTEVAIAAIGVARPFVKGREGVSAVDRLTAIAVDRARPATVRAAAVDALKELPPPTIEPLLKQVAADPALLSAEPEAMRATIAASAKAPLPSLLKLVEDIRHREQTAPRDVRGEWLAVRGAAHALVARRGSTIALYDLRETIERAAAPLPADFITALSRIGDATCLEPVAAAYAKARDLWWKKSLADAFRAIVKREKITRRHGVMKKIERKWPGAVRGLGNRD